MEMMTGGIMMFAAALALKESVGFNILKVSSTSWLAFLYLIVFGSLIGFSAYIWLLTTTTSARVSTYAYVNPVVAVLLGWALASEQLTLRTVVASVIIISAVVLITSYKARKEPVPGIDEKRTKQIESML
jgi:drug/metabolite transporter (DMT)-like permease